MTDAFSVGVYANQFSERTEFDRNTLLEVSDSVIRAYEEHYDILSKEVDGINVCENEEGGTDVDYILTLNMVLKYKDAAELPHVKGIANELGITCENSDELISQVEGDKIKTLVSENMANYKNIDTISNDSADNVAEEIVDFVNEIENEYIGKADDANISLRAKFNSNGEFVKLQCEVFNGYSNDLSAVLPESEENMIDAGKKHIESILEKTSDMQSNKSVRTNSFTYNRVDAAAFFVY